ncbi:hypothetical protein BKG76_00360 [Mycobacteroides franklinii]|uniref:Lipoprotein n=2 Tax=Mycobacteroides franklinii TaxID=948102 RepID=A0A1S1LB76_9MYCO|nr:hypothetical protein BKG76_00360 [Mycobacteroides franklinii]
MTRPTLHNLLMNAVRKYWVIAWVVGVLMSAGCSPNRAEESAQISQEIRNLPGVDGTSYDEHSNPIVAFKEPSFYLKVHPRPDVTGSELSEIWKTFTRKVYDTGYSHYHVVLDVGSCPEMPFALGAFMRPCNGFSSEVDPAIPGPPTPAYEDWLAMIQGKYAHAVNGTSTSAGHDLRQRFLLALRKRADTDSTAGLPQDFQPREITTAYRRVLKDFLNLHDSGWSVTATDQSESPGLTTYGGAPDEKVLALWEQLADITVPTKTEFVMKPDKDRTSTVHVTLSTREAATSQLKLLKEYGQPVSYESTVPGEGSISVLVNGCTAAQASGWQDELRREFENCPR